MANTTEMIRLMRHAASLLDAQDARSIASEVESGTTQSTLKARVNHYAAKQAAANAMASAVLRMVAAAMDDEPEAATNLGHQVPTAAEVTG